MENGNSLCLSVDDVKTVIIGLDLLSDILSSDSAYLLGRLENLKVRISMGLTSFTAGEIKNICLGLEMLLESNPMDWKTSQLLNRFNAFLSPDR